MNYKRLTMTQEELESADSDYIGFCVNCGAEREGCEPDARRYECEECGENRVYGASELFIMGGIIINDIVNSPILRSHR